MIVLTDTVFLICSKKCQTAYKPGSVPASRGWPFIWDACRQAPQATDPGGGVETRVPANRRAAPIWSCSRWGLPCRPRYRGRGALLPHRFTLACGRSRRRSVLCGTFPGVAPAGCYPAPYFRGARTFLPSAQTEERPSGRLAATK